MAEAFPPGRSPQGLGSKEGRPMLVLSRKKNESIEVGDITLTVLEVQNRRVRLEILDPQQGVVDRWFVPRKPIVIGNQQRSP